MRAPPAIAGAVVFVGALALGAARLEAALRPPTDTDPGIDLAAARARPVSALDPTLAFLLDLDPKPGAADPALSAAGLPDPLRRAMRAETGWADAELARALSAGPGPAHDEAARALGAALDHEEEAIARAAVTLACDRPDLGAPAAARAPRTRPRGRALALSVSACTRPPDDALALLTDTLKDEGELAPIAALELGRLGRIEALPLLQSTAAAHPRDLLGLVAAYSADTVSRIAATATHPDPSR